jgi:hypothetical protein
MKVKFETSSQREEKVQETSSTKVVSQEKAEVVQFEKVNGC